MGSHCSCGFVIDKHEVNYNVECEKRSPNVDELFEAAEKGHLDKCKELIDKDQDLM